MGAGLLWVGWFGFNAGSTVQSGLDTARALTMTQISAASGATMWMIIEAVKFRKVTSLGFVSGILAGLVVITPAAGVVQPNGALILGASSTVICFYALELKNRLKYDDSLDCFGIHGVGSGLGVLMLSFFIRKSWMDSASKAAGITWTAWDAVAAIGTYIICLIIQKTIGLRISKAEELAGLDHTQHRESGYGLMNLN
jgi:Amt family ammonium transporter